MTGKSKSDSLKDSIEKLVISLTKKFVEAILDLLNFDLIIVSIGRWSEIGLIIRSREEICKG